MTLLEQFAPKKKQDNGPVVPMPPKPPAVKELHSKAIEERSAAFEAIDHLEKALIEINELRIEKQVLQRSNAELQHTVDHERALKEQYMRFSIRASKSLNDISRMAHQANNEAIDEAQRVLGGIASQATVDEKVLLKAVEQDLAADASAEAIGAKFGAGTDNNEPQTTATS